MAYEVIPGEERLLRLFDRLRDLGVQQPFSDGLGVTPAQFRFLDWVAESPGGSLQDVAVGLGLTPATASVGIGRLESAGLVARQSDPRDGRAICLSLTPEGQAIYRRVQDLRRKKMHHLLAGLTPEERATLLTLLERAICAAEAVEAAEREVDSKDAQT